MTVKVKTHGGGTIESVDSSIVKLADENGVYLRGLKAVVLKVGSNNISDADPSESVVNVIIDVANTVRNVNPDTKIFISSILPRRNDRLVSNTISETNRAINNACQQHNYVHIDNDSNILNNGRPDIIMYKDTVNLNKKGGKFFGGNIK